jgi:hypothetical protein
LKLAAVTPDGILLSGFVSNVKAVCPSPECSVPMVAKSAAPLPQLGEIYIYIVVRN